MRTGVPGAHRRVRGQNINILLMEMLWNKILLISENSGYCIQGGSEVKLESSHRWNPNESQLVTISFTDNILENVELDDSSEENLSILLKLFVCAFNDLLQR